MSSDEEEREAWIADVKRRLGIRCIGDEPATKMPDWPVIEEGATYTVVSDQAMASWDGVNFYVKPDGMTTAEFWAALAAGDQRRPDQAAKRGPVAWLRAAILERKARAEALAVTVGASGWTVRRNDDFDYTVYGSNPDEPLADIWREDTAEWMADNDPRDAIARCEAELAILDEHYILYRGDTNEAYEEFSVCYPPGIPGLNCGCATCHYKGFGGVEQYGICRTVKFLASGYRHKPGYREEDWRPGVTPWQAGL